MVKWLPKDIPNKVPCFGFHEVGVGSLVLNQSNEILLVKEKFRGPDRWKMPGGLVDPGETLEEAAIREVKEETGVLAKFESVLGFWQRTLNKHLSDIYIVCFLSVKDECSASIQFDPHEIEECRWMHLGEYVDKGKHAQHPLLMAVLERNFGITKPHHAKMKNEITDSSFSSASPHVHLPASSLLMDPNRKSKPVVTFLPQIEN
eukprot:CAMPEP_0204842154 /NCGR_PEP_ID=MMETSP1346-20131115/44983_1 /ASSEMBLY_ACC=CAM_ASM_000771 /TAXON_ID=215587 /ORGANISM="Aplanochytrium stocchinoi, Strain GSBS06" /LENGTH=203 /DNA_ID=CAMNT_0051980747 /DNA_START=415 /DNA_END=1026 /DNA_ORIENTATION=+